jgi:hypothetical protein
MSAIWLTLEKCLDNAPKGGYFSTWDLKAGYFHVVIHPAFRKYFGFKVGDVYLHYNAMCFGWSEACFIYTMVTQEAARELRMFKVPISSYLDDGSTGDE